MEGMQIFENFETIIVYHGQTKSHYCNVLGIAVTCSLSIFKVGSQIRCLEYENVHVQSEIASTLHFTLYTLGLEMGETDITNKSNSDITRRIEWWLQKLPIRVTLNYRFL